VAVWRNSQTLFQQCLQVNPNSFFARLNLGNALVEAGRLHDAVPILRSAIAASGEYKVKYKPHASLARTLHQLGEREEAEQAYERAILLAPGWAHLRNDYGVLLAESGRFCEAAHCFREARRLGLDTPEVRQNLVAAETRCGEQSTEK
jgi:Tfp pilus assembly protein PilF